MTYRMFQMTQHAMQHAAERGFDSVILELTVIARQGRTLNATANAKPVSINRILAIRISGESQRFSFPEDAWAWLDEECRVSSDGG